MADKIAFFYCTGTAYTFSLFNNAVQGPSVATGITYWGDRTVNPAAAPQVNDYVPGLNGKTYPWDGEVFNDPFPSMLDPSVWDAKKVAYADAAFTFMVNGQLVGGMGASIDDGVTRVKAQIDNLPAGTPFAIGGYSQGAAVMSTIYNEIRTGSLTGRASSFLGGVMFGNPRRQVNHRGEVGGTWSGAWDVPLSTSGGHGSFPDIGPWARLSGCDGTKWIEFANPGDVITATGDSSTGSLWTKGNEAMLSLLASQYAAPLVITGLLQQVPLIGGFVYNDLLAAVQTALSTGGILNYLMDLAGTPGVKPGGGHVLYPLFGPPNNSTGALPHVLKTIPTTYTATAAPTTTVVGARPRVGRLQTGATPTTITHTYMQPDGSDTCYQIALKWLEAKAAAYATAPLVLPSSGTSGWSTTLIAPA